MKTWLLWIVILAMLLSGCSGGFYGHYHEVEPFLPEEDPLNTQPVSVSDFDQLCAALAELAKQGVKSQTIIFTDYDQTKLDQDMRRAIWHVQTYDAITAYAVERITYEKGTSTSQTAAAVEFSYIHDRVDLVNIKKAQSMKKAQQIIYTALNNCEPRVVLLFDNYEATDFVQMVEDYAFRFPQMVMEVPKVSAAVYPESGTQRVVELIFTYQNSRGTLRRMQDHVSSVFSSAELYVIGKGLTMEKASLLYSFLMQRYDYQEATSITPAYSLLQYGMGDSSAFATVYAAMCEQTGLKCQVITGTRWGEPWCWNLLCVEEVYYHIDLLRCSQEEGFQTRTDADMEGYVWDFSAYPESVLPQPPETEQEGTEPTTMPTQPTQG